MVENTMGKLTRNKYHKIGEKYVKDPKYPTPFGGRSSLQDEYLAIYKDRRTYGRLQCMDVEREIGLEKEKHKINWELLKKFNLVGRSKT